jgi:hypothetical protein
MILETFFLAEEKHAIRVQNFRDDKNFQDIFGMTGVSARRWCCRMGSARVGQV